MNRVFLFVFFILISGGIYIHAMHTSKIVDRSEQSMDDSTYTYWVENIIDSTEMPTPAFNLALNGFYDLKMKGLVRNDSILTIVDFSKSSDKKRLFILDLKNKKLIKNALVAHGMQSGVDIAESFSNRRMSNKSSLGLYVTNETYIGKHGYSLRIDGMSKDLNDNARKRAIVIHGADYVSTSFINENGRVGRSFGCPAVSMDEAEEIIDLIKDGSCLYIYHPTLIPISQSALEKLP
jgi:hypothetical protein